MKPKCLVLVSGGLDSQLAIGLMQRHDIDVEGVSFFSSFSGGIKEGKMGYWVGQAARHFNIRMHYVLLRGSFVEMVRNPHSGYGSAINPCIDCKVLMLQKAHDLFSATGASFVATGEVIGQRPMSQVKQALSTIEKRSGLEGQIVRPLSGKILEATIPEKEGIITRDLFEDISGRARNRQVALARDFDLTRYPQPAGGCILTDKNYALRLTDAFTHGVSSEKEYIALQCGRLYRIDEKTKAILGRNERECDMLLSLAEPDDTILLLAQELPGPLVLLKGMPSAEVLMRAGQLVKQFSKQKTSDQTDIVYFNKKRNERKTMSVPSIDEGLLASFLVV